MEAGHLLRGHAVHFRRSTEPAAAAVDFWLWELRTPELLQKAAAAYPERAKVLAPERPALAAALSGDGERVRELLEAEER